MTPQQIEALNIARQCRATASSPLAKNILVDEGNGLLTELLLDAARIIEALAQPEQIQPSAYSNTHQPEQEPVAWDNCRSEKQCQSWCGNSACGSHWSDTTPPHRKPLTDEEIYKIANDLFYGNGPCDTLAMCRAIEQAHGIKE